MQKGGTHIERRLKTHGLGFLISAYQQIDGAVGLSWREQAKGKVKLRADKHKRDKLLTKKANLSNPVSLVSALLRICLPEIEFCAKALKAGLFATEIFLCRQALNYN